jgi:hypothetical protein
MVMPKLKEGKIVFKYFHVLYRQYKIFKLLGNIYLFILGNEPKNPNIRPEINKYV